MIFGCIGTINHRDHVMEQISRYIYSYELYRGVAVGVGLLAHLSDGLSAVLHQHDHQH